MAKRYGVALVWAVGGLTLAGGLVPAAAAQTRVSQEVSDELPSYEESKGGPPELRKEYNAIKSTLDGIIKNDATFAFDPKAPQGKKLVETAAKWYTYRLTWSDLRQRPGGMNELVQEYERHILQEAVKNGASPDFIRALNTQMLACMTKVLQTDLLVNRVNGARLLARMALSGQDDVTDFLIRVLEDREQIDAVKFYVVRGLRDVFTQPRRARGNEDRAIRALTGFLVSKFQQPDDLPKLEADGVRYVRREAIRALGATQAPALKKDKNATALVLLRVVAEDGVKPAPSLSERVEAAVAVSNLKVRAFPDYQPDYAAYHIGRFLLDFAQQAERDRNSSTKTYPWHGEAARLRAALDQLRANQTDSEDVNRNVAEMVRRATRLLNDIESNNAANEADLRDWLTNKPAKLSPSLFKGDDRAVVKEAPSVAGD